MVAVAWIPVGSDEHACQRVQLQKGHCYPSHSQWEDHYFEQVQQVVVLVLQQQQMWQQMGQQTGQQVGQQAEQLT
jgi:hypothetical protein